MVDGGTIPEIVKAIHDATVNRSKIDVLRSPSRVFATGLLLFTKLARLGPETRKEMVRSGAVEAIEFALDTQGTSSTKVFMLGDMPVVKNACGALAALAAEADTR